MLTTTTRHDSQVRLVRTEQAGRRGLRFRAFQTLSEDYNCCDTPRCYLHRVDRPHGYLEKDFGEGVLIDIEAPQFAGRCIQHAMGGNIGR